MTYPRRSCVIIFTPFPEERTKNFTGPVFQKAYEAFFRLSEQSGLTLYRASLNWYDAEENHFSPVWAFEDNAWVLKESIVPDVIYDKSASDTESLSKKQILAERFPFLNNPEFTLHAGSKLLASQAFPEFFKPYFLVHSQEELTSTLSMISGDMVVVKPERGNGGAGIIVAQKQEILNQNHTFPLLVQEFIDSSAGIPGVMQGLHDLRLIFTNEELIYSYYRTPKSGSYLANVAQGGKQTIVPKDKIPQSVEPIVQAVQNQYKEFTSKIYTIDIMFDRSGQPWIVELNTMPGLYPDESERPVIETLYKAIVDTLKSLIGK